MRPSGKGGVLVKLDYEQLEAELIEKLNDNKTWVLATSEDDRVTARAVSIVNSGLRVYFQTHQDYLKVRQIEANNRVALCRDHIQIEGVATNRGNPFDDGNVDFVRLYSKYHETSFKRYTRLEGQVVIEIKPKLAAMWKYIDAVPYMDYINIEDREAYRVEQKHIPIEE